MSKLEILISAIQERPALWDKRNKRYYNRLISYREWKAVAEIIGSTSDVVRKKWKNLRDTFAREYKKIPKPQSGTDAETQSEYNGTWPFFESMSFLKVVIKSRKSDGNIHEPYSEIFPKIENDNADLSKSTMKTTNIPEKSVLTVTRDHFIGDFQNNSIEMSSMSRPSAESVNDINERNSSTQNQLPPKEQLDGDDENTHWFKSILPYMKQLPPLNILSFRTQVQGLLLTEISKINTPQKISFPK